MVEIAETIEALEALAPLWKRVERGGVSVFGCYAWCRSAWENVLAKERGNRLWVICWIRNRERRVAWADVPAEDAVILPTYIDRRGTLRFALDTHCDVCDGIGTGPWICFKEIAEAIAAERRIRRICLRKLPEGSWIKRGLGTALPYGWIVRDTAHAVLYMPKTDDIAGAMTQMTSRERKVLRSVLRHSENLAVRLCRRGADMAFPRESIVFLRSAMQAEGVRGRDFLSDDLLAVAEALWLDGRCEVAVAERDGAPVTATLVLLNGERALLWFCLYTDARLTSVLDAWVLAEKAREGACTVDFGTGLYGYKMGTFRPTPELTSALRYAKGSWGRLMDGAWVLLRFMREVWNGRRRR